MSKGKNAKYVPTKQSNTMTYVLGGVALLVVIVVVIGGVLFMSKKDSSDAGGTTPAYVVGRADAPTTLDFFEDPMCPACGAMEKQYGEQITKAIQDGKLKARYHLLSFLNRQSASGDYSDRAGGAMLAIASSSMPDDLKQKALLATHTALFAQQPEEGSPSDHSNAELARILGDAAKAGGAELPADVTDAIKSGRYTAQSAKNAQAASKRMQEVGGTGTPTVALNDKPIELSGDWLTPLLK